MKYGVVKMKAQMFANERQQPVYIVHAKQNGHCMILFEEDLEAYHTGTERRVGPQHQIIETVYPETATL